MRLNYILSAISIILIGFGIMAFLPVFVALYYQDYGSFVPFITASAISIVLGLIFKKFFVAEDNYNDLRKKEGLFIVALTWIAISLIATIPYFFYDITPINALFEGVSGITTTGASVLKDFSLYPPALFFWRSFTQWLGGMGVIVLFIAILPQFAVAGRQMFSAEAPGPTEDKIAPRIKYTAIALWIVYLSLTIIEIFMLKVAGMPLFDALCNSLSTIAAGGFSPNPDSIAGYHNPHIIWIITWFMFFAGVNFSLQYRVVVQRQFKSMLHSTEFLTYLFIFLSVSLIIALSLIFQNHYGILSAVRNSTFQVISIMTSTGFASVDFDSWSNFAKIFLFLLMLIGGSAGSASGGIKVVRVIIVLKYLWREICLILHPKSVLPIKLGKNIIQEEVIRQILVFVIFYIIILIVTSIITSAIEHSLMIGIVGSASTLGNVGPGFDKIGPYGTFADLNPFTKIIFIINMIIGRLELIPFIAMLHMDFWKFTFKRSNK